MVMFVQLPKGFDPYVPKTVYRKKTNAMQNTILSMFTVMFDKGYALPLNRWLNSQFKDIRQSLGYGSWSQNVTLDAVIEGIRYEDEKKVLEKIRDWDERLTYVLLMESFKDDAHYIWDSHAGYHLAEEYKTFMKCIEEMFDKTATMYL